MEGKIFEGQYDQVVEEDYHELLDEISNQLVDKLGIVYDDSQVKFRIKVEIVNDWCLVVRGERDKIIRWYT